MCKDNICIDVGASLLISGSLSASLVSERVVAELGRRQNNLLSHLKMTLGIMQWDFVGKPSEMTQALPPGPQRSDEESMLLATHCVKQPEDWDPVHEWARTRLAFTLIDPRLFPSPGWLLKVEGLDLTTIDHVRRIADQYRDNVEATGSVEEKLAYFGGVLDALEMAETDDNPGGGGPP